MLNFGGVSSVENRLVTRGQSTNREHQKHGQIPAYLNLRASATGMSP